MTELAPEAVSRCSGANPDIKITPRIVYQEVRADGFNREEVFNLYSNEFTIPPHEPEGREQFLRLREEFEDNTLLADLTASFAFGAVELTSITSFIDRDILASRDASALTGSVSVDLAFPDAGVNLNSNLRDTTKLKQWSRSCALSRPGMARCNGLSADSTRTSTAIMRNTYLLRAMPYSSTRSLPRKPQQITRTASPTRSPSVHPTCSSDIRQKARSAKRPTTSASSSSPAVAAITTSTRNATSTRAASRTGTTSSVTRPRRAGSASRYRYLGAELNLSVNVQAAMGFRLWHQ